MPVCVHSFMMTDESHEGLRDLKSRTSRLVFHRRHPGPPVCIQGFKRRSIRRAEDFYAGMPLSAIAEVLCTSDLAKRLRILRTDLYLDAHQHSMINDW